MILLFILLVLIILIELRFHPRLDKIGRYKGHSTRKIFILWYDSYTEDGIKRRYIELFE